MFIITPTGKLFEVSQAVPVVERYVKFNGSVRRLAETAKDFSANPNAIAMENAHAGLFDPSGIVPLVPNVFIGNLSAKKVKEILCSLLKDGYYDFSSLEYQKPQHVEELVWDEGKSLPYSNEYTPFFVGGNFFDNGSNAFRGTICAEEEGDDYDEE